MALEVVFGLKHEEILTEVIDVQSAHLLVFAVIIVLVLLLDLLKLFSISYLELLWRLFDGSFAFRSRFLRLLLLLQEFLDQVLVLGHSVVEPVALVVELLPDVLDLFRPVDLELWAEVALAQPRVIEYLLHFDSLVLEFLKHVENQRDASCRHELLLAKDFSEDDLMIELIPFRRWWLFTRLYTVERSVLPVSLKW